MKKDTMKNHLKLLWQCYIVLGTLFLISFVSQMIMDIRYYPYDADAYWTAALQAQGQITDMVFIFRGYVLPLFFYYINKFGVICFADEYIGYRIVSSLIFAFFFSFGTHRIIRMIKAEITPVLEMLFSILTGVVFFISCYGVIVYPLSDFYAMVLCFISIFSAQTIVMNEEETIPVIIIRAFILGILLYATYDIRPIYEYSGIILIVVLMSRIIIKRRYTLIPAVVIPLLIGILLAATPQYIQNRAHDVPSFRVQNGSLMVEQLTWGIRYDRYDTYIGADEYHELDTPRVFYLDPEGTQMLRSAGIDDDSRLDSVKDYIVLCLRHPMKAAGIYSRHLLNMMYTFYPEVYIKKMCNTPKLINMLFFYILFVGCISAFIHDVIDREYKFSYRTIGVLMISVIPCGLVLPGAVESRFFIAPYYMIFLIGIICFGDFLRRWRARPVSLTIGMTAGFMLYYAYAGYMLATIQGGSIVM